MKKVSVIILNWNGIDLLREYLPSVRQFTDPGIADVIIADNGSDDGSVDFVYRNYPDFRVFAMTENNGFAQGYNVAIDKIKTEYCVLLNSDVRVTEGWLEPMLEYAEANPDVAGIQPKILSIREEGKFEYAGAAGGFIDKYGFPFCRGRIFSTLEHDTGQYDTVKDIFWATGACFFTRTAMYKKAGGLDREFFAHMEEIDLCWRFHNMGHRVTCVPQGAVYHLGGATLDAENPRKTYLNFRNSLLMLYKNLPSAGRNKTLFIRKVFDAFAALRFLLKGDLKNLSAVYDAHTDASSMIKSIYANHKKGDESNLLGKFPYARRSIVIDYYLKGKKKFSSLNE